MINRNKGNNYAMYAWLLLVFLFFLLRLPDFLANAFVPDELWHTQHMYDIKHAAYLQVDNYQGHGSAFWYFGALIERFFNDQITFFILRIFSLLSLTATAFLLILPFKISFQERTQQQTVILFTIILFTIFVLTLPLFWWGGKLIFPEFFQCFLIALSYYLIYIKKKYSLFAFFALGFCLGLKLDAGVAIAFFVADNFFANLTVAKFKYFMGHILALILGFLVCNPTLLVNPHLFIENIRANGHYFDGSFRAILSHWGDVLTGRYSEWDLVYFGGINKTSIPLINLFLIAVMIYLACRQKKIHLVSLLIFLFSAIFAFTINQRFLSYYAFTMIILAILLATNATNFKIKYLNIFLFIGILLNVYITAPNVIQNRELSRELVENLQHAQQHTECILAAIPYPNNIGLIIDNTDMGGNSKREKFLFKPIFLAKETTLGLPKNVAFISDLDTENFFTNDVSANHASIMDILGKNTLKKNRIASVKPEVISAFINGNIEILYLDGARTRKIEKYSEFIPALTLVLSHMKKKRVALNVLYLDDCFGTRVNLLSINNGG